jgi:uncharacterized protein YfiM (DUF2279 family)
MYVISMMAMFNSAMLAARGIKSGSQRNISASTETLSTVSVGLNHGGSASVLPSPHTPSGILYHHIGILLY